MSHNGYIESIAFITNQLFETLREEEGVKIQARRPGFLTGADVIMFWVHPAENLDFDTLEQRIQESNVFYAQYNNQHVFDYLAIKLDKYSQLISLTIRGMAALYAIKEVKGDPTGEEQLPSRRTGEQVTYGMLNAVPGLGYLAGKLGDHMTAKVMRSLKDDVLQAFSLQFLIAIVQYLIGPRD